MELLDPGPYRGPTRPSYGCEKGSSFYRGQGILAEAGCPMNAKLCLAQSLMGNATFRSSRVYLGSLLSLPQLNANPTLVNLFPNRA